MSIVRTPEFRTVVKNVHAVHNVKIITAGITALLLPSPRYYRKVSFHPHGITVISQTITAGFTAVTAVIPLSPLPCHSLVHCVNLCGMWSLVSSICPIHESYNYGTCMCLALQFIGSLSFKLYQYSLFDI